MHFAMKKKIHKKIPNLIKRERNLCRIIHSEFFIRSHLSWMRIGERRIHNEISIISIWFIFMNSNIYIYSSIRVGVCGTILLMYTAINGIMDGCYDHQLFLVVTCTFTKSDESYSPIAHSYAIRHSQIQTLTVCLWQSEEHIPFRCSNIIIFILNVIAWDYRDRAHFNWWRSSSMI